MEEMFAVNPTTIVSSIIIKDTCNAVKWKIDRVETTGKMKKDPQKDIQEV